MTGETKTSWTWLHRVVVPAILAAVGATWVSTWLSALVHVGTRPAGLSYPLVAAPVVAAVTATAVARRHVPEGSWRTARAAASSGPRALRRSLRRSARVPTTVPGGSAGSQLGGLASVGWVSVVTLAWVAAVASTAGSASSALGRAGWLVAATHPWSLRGSDPTGAADLGWFVAVGSWAVGTWLSRREVDEQRALRWNATAAGALTLFFLVAALHGGHLRQLAGGAAVLLLVAFPGAAATLALVHQRDLERRVLHRAAAPPGAVWLAALGAPMAALAGLAVLAALLVGPVAPVIGHGLHQVFDWVIGAIVALLRGIRGLPHVRKPTALPPPAAVGTRRIIATRSGASPLWVTVLLDSLLGAALLVAVVAVAAKVLRWYRGRRSHPSVPAETEAEVLSDSVFSWSHLFRQLRDALIRRRPRLRLSIRHPKPPTADLSPPTTPTTQRPGESVRAEYRRLLAAAADAGKARARAETPLELAARLAIPRPDRPAPLPGAGGERDGSAGVESTLAGAGATDDLGQLTELYDEVRYGAAPDGGERAEVAGRLTASVASWLRAPDGDREPAS